MKKFVCIALTILVLGVIAWFILLRPSDISQELVTESFKSKEKSFMVVAEYLVDNNITTEINGLLTHDNNYGVPIINENDYRKFNEAVEVIMYKGFVSIVSDGESVEFIYESSGGILNRLGASIIYNGKDRVDGKPTVRLNNNGWHLYIKQE